jgi:beta-glucanase (GH16 family)
MRNAVTFLDRFMRTSRTNKIIAVTCALAVGIAGFVFFASMAAGFFAAVEVDNATLSTNARLVNDATASGGRAIQFTAPSPTPTPPPPTPTPTPPPPPPPGGGCPAGQIGTPPNCYPAPPAPAAAGKQWKMMWGEEFNGVDYDHAKLSPCFDWNYGACTNTFNNGREHYAASQVRVSGGTAKLVAEPHSPPYPSSACQNGQCTYYSGLLSTSRPRADNGSDYLYKFTYGYIEGSLKLPATRGFFTAFWMLPANPSFTYGTEIDILENLGNDSKTMFMTYHYNNRSQSHNVNSGLNNNGSCPAKDHSGAFHTFALDWQPTHVAWYIDGVKCGQYNGNSSTIESGPMQIILDLMVDNNWQRSWNVGLADPTLVRQLEVDYLRVYQQQ